MAKVKKGIKCTECNKVLEDPKISSNFNELGQVFVVCGNCNNVMVGDVKNDSLYRVIATSKEDTPGTRAMMALAKKLLSGNRDAGMRLTKLGKYIDLEDSDDGADKSSVKKSTKPKSTTKKSVTKKSAVKKKEVEPEDELKHETKITNLEEHLSLNPIHVQLRIDNLSEKLVNGIESIKEMTLTKDKLLDLLDNMIRPSNCIENLFQTSAARYESMTFIEKSKIIMKGLKRLIVILGSL
jgi:hypothetical protein